MIPGIDWAQLLAAVEPPAGVAGVGVDLEAVEALRRRVRDPAALFTRRERSYCESRADPWESYAGTWCAKEAVVKALARVARLSVRQVEILRDGTGRPVVAWTDQDGEDLGRRFEVHVSIAHTQGVAVAVALAVARPAPR